MTNLIDPTKITNFNRNQKELELFWLFALCVAGKTATVQANKLNNFLSKSDKNPFDYVRELIESDRLVNELRLVGMGQYARLERAFKESLSLDLANDPVDKFEAIYGVSHKTARFFILHSRENQRYAALDTHMLKFLTEKEHWNRKGAPTGKKYLELEQIFLGYADEAGLSVADFDLILWKKYSGNEATVT